METYITSCIVILVLLMSSELVHSTLGESSSTSNHDKVSKKSPRSISRYKSPNDGREISQVFIDAEKRAGETNRNENEPECSPKCVNGEAEVNTCDCKFGWMGESCSESFFCVVIQPTNASGLEPSYQQKKIEVSTEDVFMERKRPKCTAECIQSTSIAVDVLHRADMAYYLLPINTTCDTGKAYVHTLVQYKYLIAEGTAILLLAIIICTTVCVSCEGKENQESYWTQQSMSPQLHIPRSPRGDHPRNRTNSGNDYDYDYVDVTNQSKVYDYAMK